MQITFNSYEEMMVFVGKIQTEEKEDRNGQAVPIQSVPTPVQVAPVPVAVENPGMPQALPTAPDPVMVSAPPTQQVPTSTVTYTLDNLASAAMTLMDKGMQVQLQELLASFGVEALPQLPVTQFGAFATALRGMGAQI